MNGAATMSALTQETAAGGSLQTVWEFLWSGGPVMVPLGMLSVVAVAFAMERYLRLRREAVLPQAARPALELAAAGELQQARVAAEQVDAPVTRILLAGLRRDGLPLFDVERAMEDQAHKELDRLRGGVRPLALIATVAPLLGLLGTVIGIADAFHRVVRTGMGKPENLAAGIEQALVTTIVGLCIAIPTLLVAAHLNARARRLLHGIDDALAPAVDAIAGAQARARSEHAA